MTWCFPLITDKRGRVLCIDAVSKYSGPRMFELSDQSSGSPMPQMQSSSKSVQAQDQLNINPQAFYA